MIDAPWYIDFALMLVMFAAAFYQAVAIRLVGFTWMRMGQVVGWTGLVSRFFYGLAIDGNVPINVASLPFLTIIAASSFYAAFKDVRAYGLNLRCINDPGLPCHRIDRIEIAIGERKRPRH